MIVQILQSDIDSLSHLSLRQRKRESPAARAVARAMREAGYPVSGARYLRYKVAVELTTGKTIYVPLPASWPWERWLTGGVVDPMSFEVDVAPAAGIELEVWLYSARVA